METMQQPRVLDPAFLTELDAMQARVVAEQAPTAAHSSVYASTGLGNLEQVGDTETFLVDRSAESKRTLGAAVGAAILPAENYVPEFRSQRGMIAAAVQHHIAFHQQMEANRLASEHGVDKDDDTDVTAKKKKKKKELVLAA